MTNEFRRLSRDLIHKGNIIDYYKDTVAVPNGNIAKWDFIKHNGAAAVIPVTGDGKIMMVSQYRNAIDAYTLEIPAGGLKNTEETTMACAFRELEEETGYKTSNLDFLLSLYTTVAFCNEKIDIYVAHHLIPSKQNLDEDEFITVKEFDLDELCEMIFTGRIIDAKTIAAIMAYKHKYGDKK